MPARKKSRRGYNLCKASRNNSNTTIQFTEGRSVINDSSATNSSTQVSENGASVIHYNEPNKYCFNCLRIEYENIQIVDTLKSNIMFRKKNCFFNRMTMNKILFLYAMIVTNIYRQNKIIGKTCGIYGI